mmetsp:Transcript_18061/g.44882  ORF Transcript_18061/g.44882 Transcript_18061/m.44882 type:complete len:355 (+) Transcript_18061:1722-2786(+)
MAQKVAAIATHDKTGHLTKFEIERRAPGPKDVVINIKYSGICHSDLHQARSEWGPSIYPMVPGHEIVGIVEEVGAEVTGFKVGQRAGVGCFVESCRKCVQCEKSHGQYCPEMVVTYNGKFPDGTPTYGGYSAKIVVDEAYTLHVPEHLDFKATAPLLCAGITVYSPFRHYGLKAGESVGVLGLGGLGHMAVKIARAMGCKVTIITRSADKAKEAIEKLGAHDAIITSEEGAIAKRASSLDFILDTVSAAHSLKDYLPLMKVNGRFILVGVPSEPFALNSFDVVMKRLTVGGSLIGGIEETQEMLDFCGEHNIVADIELISCEKVNEAYERLARSDVRYRFVLDIENTIGDAPSQ